MFPMKSYKLWSQLLVYKTEEDNRDSKFKTGKQKDAHESLQRGQEAISSEDVGTRLDEDDSGFQILTEEEIIDSLTRSADFLEDKEQEAEDNTQSIIRANRLSLVIQYVQQSSNGNVFVYHEYLWHLSELLAKEINNNQSQQKMNYFFKPVN
ncbi:hypothetical protein PR048_012879, partial [Dryococelus australis]